MAIFTGDDGKVLIGGTPLADISAWSLEMRAATKSYASSATGGYRKQVIGSRHGAGTVRFLLDPADPITDKLDKGAAVTLKLYLDDTRFFSVPAIIAAVRLNIEIDEGKLVGGEAEFVTQGEWAKPVY
jgi:hypothetical protein